ncbi:hypothetical protein GCM10027088_24050 [Nocardia goodfellowii]|uniref:Broad specificity phosphatase PhoE n=1 Tax=Nocardia goodfellowii TaxID=882446 RepID=A0ABS4QCH7_9NOCA|nr:broad specificity phosphatase PhoE [Nocardia goodfellowii]
MSSDLEQPGADKRELTSFAPETAATGPEFSADPAAVQAAAAALDAGLAAADVEAEAVAAAVVHAVAADLAAEGDARAAAEFAAAGYADAPSQDAPFSEAEAAAGAEEVSALIEQAGAPDDSVDPMRDAVVAEQVSTDAAASVALLEGADVADAVVRAADAEDAAPAEAAPRVSGTATRARAVAPEAGDLDPVDEGVETIVHVVRHGEVHNPRGILYGRLPGFALSVAGRAQAGAVARSLSDHDIALVIASPLQRAQETAAPIAGAHNLIVRTDENLLEAGNTFEGLRVSVGDGALRKPRHWWKLRDPFTPSWGEPYLQIAHRMLAAVNKARVEAAGHEAVLVSHQLPVWTLRRFLQGQRLWHDPRQRQCSLASLTSLVYQGDTLVDIVYSEPAGGSDPTVHGA